MLLKYLLTTSDYIFDLSAQLLTMTPAKAYKQISVVLSLSYSSSVFQLSVW